MLSRIPSLALFGLATLAITLPLSLSAAPVGGGHGQGPGHQAIRQMALHFLESPEVREQADVSDEQIDQIKEIVHEAETAAITIRAELEIAELELRRLWDQDDPSPDEIHAAIDRTSELQAALRHTMADARLQGHDVLSPDQRETIRSLVVERLTERREQMRDRGQRFGQRRGELRQRFQGFPGATVPSPPETE